MSSLQTQTSKSSSFHNHQLPGDVCSLLAKKRSSWWLKSSSYQPQQHKRWILSRQQQTLCWTLWRCRSFCPTTFLSRSPCRICFSFQLCLRVRYRVRVSFQVRVLFPVEVWLRVEVWLLRAVLSHLGVSLRVEVFRLRAVLLLPAAQFPVRVLFLQSVQSSLHHQMSHLLHRPVWFRV